MLDDLTRRSRFGRTLPCKEVEADKKTKQDHANQGQADKSPLSCYHRSSFRVYNYSCLAHPYNYIIRLNRPQGLTCSQP
jgi:hypothetical protein